MNPCQNQGHVGTCWMMASCAVLESWFNIYHKSSDSSDKMYKVSEYQLGQLIQTPKVKIGSDGKYEWCLSQGGLGINEWDGKTNCDFGVCDNSVPVIEADNPNDILENYKTFFTKYACGTNEGCDQARK